ncbi:hypothetical protein [Williamwhitmania taraxaci]|uniref:Uncharacterized protein n=1 Tax=Williamwhitmania taraxaci TaxID=1640674 RepID=A0A1G6RGL0_9BACT|nr:hypothetical protein [Williamwhitmania taraxaci]SDD03504.1 hypothetical protein SAMN05216323_10749 [Williamwhitmania taraxaci]
MSNMNSTLDFLKVVVVITATQLMWILGTLFIFGFILYLLARFTRATYAKTVGWKLDVVATGWIGTPVHELGHALFCLIFRHRIVEIKLFTPNSTDGTIGYVNHTYDRTSIYQRIGNFFIGVGPIIFGAVVLYAALYYLLPNAKEVMASIDAQSKVMASANQLSFGAIFDSLKGTAISTLESLFFWSNFSHLLFWVFLYVAVCISSHMELSPSDIKGALSGLISLVLFFLLINTIIMLLEVTGVSNHFGHWWSYLKIESYGGVINKYVGMFAALFIFAGIISALNFIFSYVVLNIYSLIKGDGMVNPFW